MSDQLKNYLKDLKAQAYDTLANIEYLQRQLGQVNQEISKVSGEVTAAEQRLEKSVEKKTESPVVEEKQLLTE